MQGGCGAAMLLSDFAILIAGMVLFATLPAPTPNVFESKFGRYAKPLTAPQWAYRATDKNDGIIPPIIAVLS